MNLRKHMGMVIAVGVVFVFTVVAVIMLLKFNKTYQKVQSDLKTTTSRLDALYNRDPYPSVENVSLVESNLTVLDAYFADLFSSLKEGQIEPANMEPAEFPLLLDKTIRKLYEQAMSQNVELPTRFAFGFERYALGALPNEEDVSRLVLQVKTVEALCQLLLRAKINEIVAVERTVFEKGLAEEKRGGGRSRRPWEAPSMEEEDEATKEWVDPSGLFARETYTLRFKGPDGSVWALLDACAESKVFAVVSEVNLNSDKPVDKAGPARQNLFPGVQPLGGAFPQAGKAKPAASATDMEDGPESHEERIAAGRELVDAAVQVRVYRFLNNDEQGSEQP